MRMYVFEYPLPLFISANHGNKNKKGINFNMKSKINNGSALVGKAWP